MAALSRLKILIADDHSFFRMGLAATLNELPFVKSISEASNGIEVLQEMSTQQFDIVFLDIQMPHLDGIATLKRIRQHDQHTKIIALSMHSAEQYVLEMYQNGVDAYLLKDTDYTEVKRAIENVIDNEQYFAQPVREILFKALIKKDKTEQKPTDLIEHHAFSPREIEVLKMICQQFSTNEIANQLMISPNTVKGHREKLLQKSRTKNVAGLAIYAVKHGYFDLK